VNAETKLSLSIRDSFRGLIDIIKNPLTVIRALVIGIYIGVLPVLGPGTASIMAYLTEKKYSFEKEKFGQGAPTGLIAAEVSKGCCTIGDLIPTFTLGIPGSMTGAILLGAFVLHGVQPGPQFLLKGSVPYIVFSGIIFTQIIMVIIGIPLIRYTALIVKVPNAFIAPLITVLCFIGSIVERSIAFDIIFLLMFGILGYVLNRFKYSTISLAIGVIIGNLVETNFHRTLSIGDGSPHLLWTRPIALSFLVITIIFLVWPYIKEICFYFKRRFSGKTTSFAGNYQGTGSFLKEITVGEIILLCFLFMVAVVFIIEAKNYPADVRIFPLLVSGLMLFLIAWLAISHISKHVKIAPIMWKKLRLSNNAMPWQWSVTIFLGYYFLIHIIGFLSATAILLIAIPTLLRYRSKITIFIFAGLSVLFFGIFVNLLHVQFPQPILNVFF
jgi:hypothetical protein